MVNSGSLPDLLSSPVLAGLRPRSVSQVDTPTRRAKSTEDLVLLGADLPQAGGKHRRKSIMKYITRLGRNNKKTISTPVSSATPTAVSTPLEAAPPEVTPVAPASPLTRRGSLMHSRSAGNLLDLSVFEHESSV